MSNCIDSYQNRISVNSDGSLILTGQGTALQGKRVKVYRNLGNHTPRKWSIVDPQTGLVIGHADHVHLTGVKLIVGQSGRERVQQEGRKNVHAYAVGELQVERVQQESPDEQAPTRSLSLTDEVTYNPYKNNFFYLRESGEPVLSAKRLVLDDSGTAFLAEVH